MVGQGGEPLLFRERFADWPDLSHQKAIKKVRPPTHTFHTTTLVPLQETSEKREHIKDERSQLLPPFLLFEHNRCTNNTSR
jgi:hypothetical protein